MKVWIVSFVGIAIISLLICAVLSVPPSGAQGPDAPPGPPSGAPPGPPGGPTGPGPGGPFDPGRMNPLMQALDTNGDGELSAEEVANASQSLKKLDRNNDAKLSREELRPQFAGRGGPGGPGGMGAFAPGIPRGGSRFGPGGPGMGPGGPDERTSMEAPPTAKDDAEAKILQALQEIPKQQGWRANVPPIDGRLLRLLAEALDAKSVVEVGTSNGISSIWLALALRKTGGKLITHEIDPDTAATARKNFAAAGVDHLITVVVGDAHQTVARLKGPIDLVFIDADKEGYLDYFQKLLPLVRPGGLIVAHNMNPRMADPAFLKAITTNPDVETLFYLHGGGMSISLKKRLLGAR